MPIAQVRGVNINYEVLGSGGPWVALSPGGRRALDNVKSLAQHVANAGYRVLIHDRRNCGLSDIAIGAEISEYEVWAEDLHELLLQLKALPAVLGGGSSGCRLSVLFALCRIAHAREGGGTVIYICKHADPPGFLVDAIAAGGALLEAGKAAAIKLPPAELAAEDLADRAFRELAAQVARRLGVPDDWASALDQLELDLRARTIVKDDERRRAVPREIDRARRDAAAHPIQARPKGHDAAPCRRLQPPGHDSPALMRLLISEISVTHLRRSACSRFMISP
jgi:pimeloyl-ACP methyl ester carboxylesterase